MKHLLLMVVFLLIPTAFFAQKDSIKITNTEHIVDKYGGKIVEGFNSVVKKITPVAEKGFEIAVRKNIAEGIVSILPLVFFILFLYLFSKEYTRIENILNSDNVPCQYDSRKGVFDENNITAPLLLYLFLIILLLIVSSFTIYNGITHLIAPEWYAIEDIFNLIK